MMKTAKLFSFVIVLLLFGQGVKGQGYIPLLDTKKTWSTLNDEGMDAHFTFWTKFTDDTIINGKTYKKVIISDTIPYPNYVPKEIHAGYIREDTAMKRIYFLNMQFEEGLIYDFVANIGDTVIIHNKCFYYINTIDSHFELTFIIDTIFYTKIIPPFYQTYSHPISLSDSIVRKVIVTRNTMDEYWTDVWIEGIGSIAGIMESGNPDRILLCYSENNLLVYYNPEFNGCSFYCLNINEYFKDLIIYPNPTSDFLHIETNQPEEPCAITLTDITGRLIYQCSFTNRIDVSHLPKGMYVLIVHTNAGQFVRKIIVQ